MEKHFTGLEIDSAHKADLVVYYEIVDTSFDHAFGTHHDKGINIMSMTGLVSSYTDDDDLALTAQIEKVGGILYDLVMGRVLDELKRIYRDELTEFDV